MNATGETFVSIRSAPAILEEVEEVYDRITRRAYDLFLTRGGDYALEIEDWMTAERDLLTKPDFQTSCMGNRFLASGKPGNLEFSRIEVVLTPHNILIWSGAAHDGPVLFRILSPIPQLRPGTLEARLENGWLILSAEIAQ